eukprot:NODE_57_length_25931_cov_0.351037.p3 type:complete len:700 gc:universal NODE_57_length_25931_cov_0.351037:11017-8918(-)
MENDIEDISKNDFEEITNYIRTTSLKTKKRSRVKKITQINLEEKVLPENVKYSEDGEYMYYSSTNSDLSKLKNSKSILKIKNTPKEKLKTRLLAKVLKRVGSIDTRSEETEKESLSSSTLVDMKKFKKVQFLLEMFPRVAEKEDEDLKYEHHNIKMSPDKILQLYIQVCSNKNVEPLPIVVDRLEKAGSGSVRFDLKGVNLSAFSVITVLSGILFYDFGLESLQVRNCSLNDERLTMILCGIETSVTLQVLDISDNNMVTDAGIRRLCETLHKLKGIRSLDLSGISMKEQKTLNCLSTCFQIQKQNALSQSNLIFQGLQTLKLDNMELNTVFQLQSLAAGVKNSNIRYLSLRKNSIDEVACFGLLRLFSSYVYDPKQEKKYVKFVERTARDLIREKDVDLEEKLQKLSAVYLNDQVQGKNGLWVLDLSHNVIRHGIFMLCDLLKTDNTIRQLNLSHNMIECTSCETIFESISENNCLEILDLSHNMIGGCEEDFVDLRKNEKSRKTEERDEYSRYIQKSLSKNTKLKSLSLAYCKLHFNSLFALGEGVRNFYALKVLDLRGNIFRFEALRAFSNEISNNTEITKVEISIAAIRSTSQSKLEDLFIKIMSICSTNLETQLREIGDIKTCSSDEDVQRVLAQISDQIRLVELATDLDVFDLESYQIRLKRLSDIQQTLITLQKLLELLPSMVNIERFQCML